LDKEQDWIEKYRAALVQPPTSRKLRLAAALSSLATALGFAFGKTSRAQGRGSAISRPTPKPEVREHPDTEGYSLEQGASKKSSPPEHRQDKKAS